MLRFYAPTHSGIYEPSDLHQLLVRQTQQPDNRIKTKQLGRISQLLEFETSTVSDYSRPWKRSMKLVASDPVGPKLLDEMHRSSQGVFAVIAGKSSREVVGLLNKDDIGLKSSGLIRDHMHGNVETINEDEPIEKSLAKFALSGQALLIVISSADEVIGTITLRDALSSLLAEDNLEEDAVAPTEEVEVSSDVPMLNLEQGGLNESS